jgi:NADPH:quinone reductase-like Zn-dependent oxidoreductase
MLKRLSYCGSTLRTRPDAYKAQVARDLVEKVWPKIAAGAVRPATFKVFPLAEAADAHRLMESAGHSGKILLRP